MCLKIFENITEKKCFFVIPLLLSASLLLLIMSISFAKDIFVSKAPEVSNNISFTGTGEVFIKPDLALITFAVQNEATTVAEAMSENTKKMNAIIDATKNLGVDGKDLETTSFNISPRYEWLDLETCINYPCPSGERILVGYEVYQSLRVKIRNLEKTGNIIQSATDMGATDVSGLQFSVDNEDELKNQARKMAIDEAKNKAKELSSQLGVNLNKIINFSESEFPAPVFLYGLEQISMGSGMPDVPRVETGENKIEVTVTITYEIN
ncbi:MAG: SIMPL domain-containing protein [Candidatus Nealsonbacteria bacterium]|nr:SIMPL domain-containing protein [Candidatus Nealsonbacteria bacterium]